MCNIEILQNLEDTLFAAEHLVSCLDKVTFVEDHAKQLLVLRQFAYGLVYEMSVTLRANSTKYY